MEIERPTPVVDEELDNLYYADELDEPCLPRKKVPTGDVFEASRAGDVERLKILLEQGVNVNARDSWDSVALYYACLTGHLDAARMLLESGAICSEHTFDGDRCHYAALNLRVRKLLKAFEARPPPLEPLQKSLRELFLSSRINSTYMEGVSGSHSYGAQSGANTPSFSADDGFNPDVTFFVRGQPIEVHRAILIARSPFFKKKFERCWKHRKEVRFANAMLTYPALFSLIHFFYTDRLDVAVDDMEDLVRVCKVCGCVALERALEKELVHQKYAEHKHLRGADDSQKRFILQGSSLMQEERLPAALEKLLFLSLSNSRKGFPVKGIRNGFHASQGPDTSEDGGCSLNSSPIGNVLERSYDNLEAALDALSLSEHDEVFEDDHADVCFLVEGKLFRSHQVVLAARSEYFRARFCRINVFCNLDVSYIKTSKGALPVLSEQDLSAEVFKKILEYMYTDKIKELDPDQAEEIFDASSRFLLFPLKRAVADALLPQLETASPADLCQWLLIADMYGVWKLREYCLDAMAANFDAFASTKEFGRMLRVLPRPSGDSCRRTTVPRAPGQQGDEAQGNLLDDLRDKWLEAEAADLDQRDESALQFDMRLEQLLLLALENDAP